MALFRRSKSNSSQSEKMPLTPDVSIPNKSKSDNNLISRSTNINLSKLLTNSSKPKLFDDQQSFRNRLKHLDFNDKENKTMNKERNNMEMNKKEKEMNIKNEMNTIKNINCITSSPFEYGCLFWEIEWNAIEIELKTKTNGVIRSVPIEVGGHLFFVELYPRISNQNIKINLNTNDQNIPIIRNKEKNNNNNNNTPNVHNCKFNFFVKSNKTPFHAKFAVYYTKKVKNENIAWKSIYSPNILVFKKNGAGFDKIVKFSDLSSLCVDKKLRLKIEVQVFGSVITKTVQNKQKNIHQNLENKIYEKNQEIRKIKYQQLLENGKFSDVLLICNGTKFNVHSFILSSFSSKFSMLLNEQNKTENNTYCIDLGSDWNPKIVNALLIFMYTQQIMDDVDLFEMIKIADTFQMERLILICLFKLSSKLNMLQSNVLEILLWTKKYHHIQEIIDIENMCLKYITNNLNQVINDKKFQLIGNKNPKIFQKVLQFMAQNNQ